MGIEIGQTISHYKILRKLGHGGMGEVYEAHDEKLNRSVALKFLKPEFVQDQEYRQRFLREANSAAAVTHPYIASIYDAGEADGTLFIAMEFVEGQTLRVLLKNGPLPIPDAQRYATETAEGLAKAHQVGLVHRDIKPDNVMVASDGHVKILDFGLAKLVERRDEQATLSMAAEAAPSLTLNGEILGTPAYMSPEQVRGEQVDSRSDIFSLGVMLYEMATGKAAFRGPTHQDTLAAILREEPPQSIELNQNIPSELNRITSRCLRKNPDERYNDTRDLVAALKDSQRTSGTLQQRQFARTHTPRRRKSGRLTVLAATGLAAIAIFAWFGPWERGETPGSPGDSPEGLINASSHAESDPDRTKAAVTPNWILVAEFDGPPGEEALADAAQQLVIASLTQSNVVTPIPDSEIYRTLRLAMKPDTTRLKGEIAREMAVRAGARTYVEGRVDRVLQGFSLILVTKDSETGHVVHSIQETATNDEDLITKLEAIAHQLRATLGELQDSVWHTKPFDQAMTPSFPAYLKFLEAQRFINDARSGDAILAFREALALDPDFAFAWTNLGMAYVNVGARDSARTAIGEALRRRDRLTEVAKLRAQFFLTVTEFDYHKGLQILDRWSRLSPLDYALYNFLGHSLDRLGRPEEALVAHRRNAELWPYAPPSIIYATIFGTLLRLGRHEEARALLEKMSDLHRQRSELQLSLSLSDWARAESVATTLSKSLDGNLTAQFVLAGLKAARGSLRSSATDLERLAHSPRYWSQWSCFMRFFLATLSQRNAALPVFEVCDESTAAGSIIHGIQAAAAGDIALARDHRTRISTMPVVDQRQYETDTRLLEAWIAFAEAAWDESIRLLEPLATKGRQPELTGRLPFRWLIAEAYEAKGQLEQAAEYFELVLSPTRLAYADERVFSWSFAHHRLVLLYSKMGRVENARRHWEIFEKTFMNPDPELVPMVDEAKRALAEAEAKAAL